MHIPLFENELFPLQAILPRVPPILTIPNYTIIPKILFSIINTYVLTYISNVGLLTNHITFILLLIISSSTTYHGKGTLHLSDKHIDDEFFSQTLICFLKE